MKKIFMILIFIMSAILFSGCGSNLAGEAYAYLNSSSDGNMFIKDGKLGIGTDSPSYKLAIRGKVGDTGIHMYNEADGVEFLLRSAGTWAGFGTLSSWADVRIFANNIPRMVIKASNGDVGIGTVKPDEKLVVNGNIKSLSLNGTGSAYACINSDGKFFRSMEPCIGAVENIMKPNLKIIDEYVITSSDFFNITLRIINDGDIKIAKEADFFISHVDNGDFASILSKNDCGLYNDLNPGQEFNCSFTLNNSVDQKGYFWIDLNQVSFLNNLIDETNEADNRYDIDIPAIKPNLMISFVEVKKIKVNNDVIYDMNLYILNNGYKAVIGDEVYADISHWNNSGQYPISSFNCLDRIGVNEIKNCSKRIYGDYFNTSFEFEIDSNPAWYLDNRINE